MEYMNDLTIIITVFNRHKFIDSLIKYYRDFNIIFVDSSTHPYKYPKGVKKLICKNKLLYDSLHEALKIVKTPYVCWNNDDDYVLKSYLKESVRILNEKPHFSNVIGLQVKPNSSYGIAPFWCWFKHQFESSIKNERIHYMMNFFHTPVHAVMRKECLIEACKIPLKDERLYPIKYFDRIVGLTQACNGDKKVIPYKSMLRRHTRLINQPSYPHKLKREVPQKQLVNLFQSTNALTVYLKDQGLSDSEIKKLILLINLKLENFQRREG